MRKKIVAGNWKMNTLPAEGVELAKGVAAGKGEVCDCVNFIVCPPSHTFIALSRPSRAQLSRLVRRIALPRLRVLTLARLQHR